MLDWVLVQMLEDKADDLLQPHSPEVKNQNLKAILQKYYDVGLKDIKAGTVFNGWVHISTGRTKDGTPTNYKPQPLTMQAVSDMSISQAAPQLSVVYKMVGKDESYTLAEFVQNKDVGWGWFLGLAFSDNSTPYYVSEDKADDVLQPHPEPVRKEKQAKLEAEMAAVIDDWKAGFPRLRAELVRWIKTEYDNRYSAIVAAEIQTQIWNIIPNKTGSELTPARGRLGPKPGQNLFYKDVFELSHELADKFYRG